MDKDQSKKKPSLTEAIKNAALNPLQKGKLKNQGNESCKMIF